jgi:hypothetical protein
MCRTAAGSWLRIGILSFATLLLTVFPSCRNNESGSLQIGNRDAPLEDCYAWGNGSRRIRNRPRRVPRLRRIGTPHSRRATTSPPPADFAGDDADNPGKALKAKLLGACDTCHVDSSDELVLSVHFKEEKIGCVKCHGKSDGHISDENNEVKPDRLFPPKVVDKFCGKCHECDRPKGTKPAKALKNRRPNCIDCHHPHSLVLTVEKD